MDRAQWMIAPYTEADLQSQIDNAPRAVRRRRANRSSTTSNELRRRHQRLHPRRAARTRPDCPPSTPRSASCRRVEAHRRDRRGVADRRHLRQGRRRRGALRAHARGVRRALRRARPAARPGRTSASTTTPRRPSRCRRRFPYETDLAVREARPRDARPGLGRRSSTTANRSKRARSPPARGCPSTTDTPAPQPIPDDGSIGSQLLHDALAGPPHASNWELVNAKHSEQRPPDRGHGPAGRLLQPADPDGGGPARARDRRARRRLPRREPVRRARPRPRLRVERHDRDRRQRRHLRRGPLPGRIPLPLQGPVPADGKARTDQHAGRRTRPTRRRPAPKR